MSGMSPAERRAAGAIVVAAFALAVISILTVVATGRGMPLILFLCVRFVVAAAVLWPAVLRDTSPAPAPAVAWRIAGAGAVGQSLVAVLTLVSLDWIPAATMVVLFYTFPAWVTLGSAVCGIERLTPARALAVLLSFLGIIALVGWPGRGGIHLVGTSFALAAAVVYAIYVPVISRLQVGVSSVRATWFVTLGVSVVFVVAVLVRGELSWSHPPAAWGAAVATGVFSTALGLLLFLRGLSVLGPVRTSILSTVEPLYAAVLALAFLGQPITIPMMAGGALILAGVVVLTLAGPRSIR